MREAGVLHYQIISLNTEDSIGSENSLRREFGPKTEGARIFQTACALKRTSDFKRKHLQDIHLNNVQIAAAWKLYACCVKSTRIWQLVNFDSKYE